jgi:hypothetical protein
MKATLRDNSAVADVRLARLRQFDERSRNFPVRDLVKSKQPRSFTWGCSQHLDQGSEGACVGFSFAHELIAKPSPVKGITAQFAIEKIYWEAQKSDPWDGGSYPGAKPKYEGTSVLEGVKAVQKLGYITEYRWAFGLDDLVMAVSQCGPAILGINWYDGMFDPHSCGYLHVGGELAGGHAILCRGVNVKGRYFLLHNSWGPNWGVKGDARISWEDIERLLHEGGEACIPVRRATTV